MAKLDAAIQAIKDANPYAYIDKELPGTTNIEMFYSGYYGSANFCATSQGLLPSEYIRKDNFFAWIDNNKEYAKLYAQKEALEDKLWKLSDFFDAFHDAVQAIEQIEKDFDLEQLKQDLDSFKTQA